jgi:hypothetical protein
MLPVPRRQDSNGSASRMRAAGSISAGIPESDDHQPDPSFCGQFFFCRSVRPNETPNRTALNRCELSSRAVRGQGDPGNAHCKVQRKDSVFLRRACIKRTPPSLQFNGSCEGCHRKHPSDCDPIRFGMRQEVNISSFVSICLVQAVSFPRQRIV